MRWYSEIEVYTYSLILLSIALIVFSLVFLCTTKRGLGEHNSFDMKKKICYLGLLQAFAWFLAWLVDDLVFVDKFSYEQYDAPCVAISYAINYTLFLVPFYVIWMMLLGGWKKCNTTPRCCSRRIYGAYFAKVMVGFCCWSVLFALFLTFSYWGSDDVVNFYRR